MISRGSVVRMVTLGLACVVPIGCSLSRVASENRNAPSLEYSPKELAEKVRGFTRVHVHRSHGEIPVFHVTGDEKMKCVGTNSTGYVELYFKGSTDDLNRFLEGLAALKGAEQSITFVPEPGEYFEWISEDAKPIVYDWCMTETDSRNWTGERDKELHVAVHFAGKIRLEKLKLPLAYRASLGGRLHEFVEGHNARIDRPAKKGATPPDLRPTSESLLESLQIRDIFVGDEETDVEAPDKSPKERVE